MFQDYLTFGEHIKKMVLNANIKLVIIWNTFHDLSREKFIVLYKSFVHPILEYCSTTWWPNRIMYHKEIENIYRRATKLIKSVTNLPYCDGLKMLDLTTLYYGRQRADIIQVYRIINSIYKLELSIFLNILLQDLQGTTVLD